MKKLSFLFAALVAGSFVSLCAFGYDYTSYNRSGLVIQYDGPDNEEGGGTSTTLANLGTMAPEYGLKQMSADDVVSDGVICMGGTSSYGWGYTNAAAQACTSTDNGFTIEYVGAMTSGESKNGYSYAVGFDNGADGGRLLYLASGQPDTKLIGAEAMAGGYNYEGTSFVKGGAILTANNSEWATRAVTLDMTTKKVIFYENGVKVGESTTKGTQTGGIKRVNLGDMRKGRGYGWWTGGMKSVRIYNRILSAEELAANYEVDQFRFYGGTFDGVDICKAKSSDITATSASVSGEFDFGNSFDATLSAIYGVAANDLTSESVIGVRNESGVYSAALTDLYPATTYFFSMKAAYGEGKVSFSATNSFTTLGCARLGAVSLFGSKADGVTASLAVEDIGYVDYAGAKVELLFGTEPGNLTVAKTWENQTAAGVFSQVITEGVSDATVYFAKFVVTLTVAEGETRTFETAIASYTTPADLVWRGAMGADWNTAANWNPSLVPFAGAAVVFEGGAKAVSSADSSVRMFKYDAKDEVAVDFGKKTLTLGALDFGENAAGTLVLSNGTFKLPNGAFNSGKGNTLVIGKGGALDTDHKLNQTANAFDLVLDGGTFTSYGNTPTVGGLVKAINGGVFTMNTSGNGGETIGPNGSNGATVMAGEGGTVKFNYVTVGGNGSVNAQVVVSNGTATCNTGPQFGGTDSAIIVMADEGKTSSFSTSGNIPGAKIIRVLGGTFSASSSQNVVIEGELEIARKSGVFKVAKAPSNGMTVNGKLIFDLPQGGYDAVPLQDAGRLGFGSNARVQVDLAEFTGVQKLITAKSITGLEASDFVFLNGKAKFCTIEITETDVTLTYKIPGLIMIIR